jgi:SAM-dependent methyltransferase
LSIRRWLTGIWPGSRDRPLEVLSAALGRSTAPLERIERPPLRLLNSPHLVRPPRTTSDPAAWDDYWRGMARSRWRGINDMFVMDGKLIDVMRANGFTMVLLVGCGSSIEPHVLALAGFQVTGLDLSPVAIDMATSISPTEKGTHHLCEGRSLQAGGSLQFAVGDLRDTRLCPGPYDVIIERRTLQLFEEAERPRATAAVASRLAPRGIFFSQCHDGLMGPGKGRRFTERYFVENEWAVWDRHSAIEGQVVWLETTTG